MHDRMLLRAYAFPLFLALLSALSFIALAWFIPAHLSKVPLFVLLAEGSRTLSTWVAGGFSLLAAGSFVMTTWRLRQWEQGEVECCRRCGGYLMEHEGRNRVYSKCAACGSRS